MRSRGKTYKYGFVIAACVSLSIFGVFVGGILGNLNGTTGYASKDGLKTATNQKDSVPESTLRAGVDYIPGEIMVEFYEVVAKESYEPILQSTDASLREASPFFGEQINNVAKKLKMDRFYRIKVDPSADHLALVDEFSSLEGVKKVYLNEIVHLDSIPDDTLFPNQTALNQVNDVDVDAPEAWDLETGSNNVVIAVLDSGIDYDHNDLKNKIWTNIDEIPGNEKDDDYNNYTDDVIGWDFVHITAEICVDADCLDEDNNPMDSLGHGTKVSGVAGAETNNGKGVASLCQDCTIMPIRACFDDGSNGACGYFEIVEGIYYAVNNGADIISMSFGSYYYWEGQSYCFFPDEDQYYQAALDYAYASGVVLVAAAGNSNFIDYAFPACYDAVIGVASHLSNGTKASFSNYGTWVDVAAPGLSVYTTKLNNTYGTASGTSLSTPFVSGLVGLLLSSFDDLSPALVRDIIIKSSEDKTYWQTNYDLAGGRINAFNAISGCIVADTFVANGACIIGEQPKKCVKQVKESDCIQCGCKTGYVCQGDGTCKRSAKFPRTTAIEKPFR